MNLQSQNPQLDITDLQQQKNTGWLQTQWNKLLSLIVALKNDVKTLGEGASSAEQITRAQLFAGLNHGLSDGLYLITDMLDAGLVLRVVSDINGYQDVENTGTGLYLNPDYQQNGTYSDSAIFGLTGVHWSGNKAVQWEATGVRADIHYYPQVHFATTLTTASLVTNGAFTANANGWTLTNATYDAIQPGVLMTANGTLVQAENLVTGQTYRLTFTVYGYTAGNVVAKLGTYTSATVNRNITVFFDIIASGSSINLEFDTNGTGVLGITNVTLVPHLAVGNLVHTPGSTGIIKATNGTTTADVAILTGDSNGDVTMIDDTNGATANIVQTVTTFTPTDNLVDNSNTGTAVILTDTPTGTSGSSPGLLTIKMVNGNFAANDQIADSNGHIAYQNGAISYDFNVSEGDIVIAVDTGGFGIFHYQKITTTITSGNPSTDTTDYKILTSDGTPNGRREITFGYIEVADAVDLDIQNLNVINRYSMSDAFSGDIYNNKVNVQTVVNFPFGYSSALDNDLLNDTGTIFANFIGAFTGNVAVANNFGTVADTSNTTNSWVHP